MLNEMCICALLLVLFVGSGVSLAQEGDYCVVEYNDVQISGVCTFSYHCPSAKRDFQNGIPPTICSRASLGTIVCCREGTNILQAPPRLQPTTKSTEPPTAAWSNRDGSKRLSERKCEEYSRPVQSNQQGFMSLLPEPETYSLTAPKCRFSKVNLIVGGTNAELGEFPHMAVIGWTNFEDGYTWDCGGALISPNFVLTAGHCSRNPNAKEPVPVVARLGDLNINTAVDDGARPVEVPIRRIIKHPEYCPPKRYNDLALLQLIAAVRLQPNIRPACLWAGAPFGKDKAIATGWGISDVETRFQPEVLQKVFLPLLDTPYCDRVMKKRRNRNWQGFRDTQMCAGEMRGGKDTCQGDSGSPLQVSSKENQCVYYIIGITSFGNQKCGERGQPAVYTRVSSYIDWIESVVWADELGITPQTESLCPPQEGNVGV